MKLIDETARRFGRLIVVEREKGKWKCRCDCGNYKLVTGTQLRNGGARSCGCLRKENTAELGRASATHGMRKSPEYSVWLSMKNRCTNPKNANYPDYGGRGISVCDEWLDFNNFYRDMGPRPKGYSIDRIDNNGNYEPSNCRWASPKTQGNNKRNNRLIECDGETKTLSEWVDETGISGPLIWWRLNAGWSANEALER